MFVFKPGNTGPATMPYSDYLVMPQGGCVLITGSRMSVQGRCSLTVPRTHSPSDERAASGQPESAVSRAPQAGSGSHGTGARFRFPVRKRRGPQIRYLNTVSLRLSASKGASPFVIETDDKVARVFLALTRRLHACPRNQRSGSLYEPFIRVPVFRILDAN